MTLRNLGNIVRKGHVDVERDGNVHTACNVIDILFEQIAASSKSKGVSTSTKTIINELFLRDSVRNGIKNFIGNMSNDDLNTLLEDIKHVLDNS